MIEKSRSTSLAFATIAILGQPPGKAKDLHLFFRLVSGRYRILYSVPYPVCIHDGLSDLGLIYCAIEKGAHLSSIFAFANLHFCCIPFYDMPRN